MIKLYLCDITDFINMLNENKMIKDCLFDKLGAERKIYIEKMKKAEDKARSLCVSYLLLFALKKENYDIDKLPEFSYMENGKPWVKEIPNVFFNLSHTKNIIACAISDKEVGVDIEHMRSVKSKYMEKIFTQEERMITNESSYDCLRLWTMKEAYAKLYGNGLKDIFEGVEVTLEENDRIVKKMNTDKIKTSCAYVVTEGFLEDKHRLSYVYSVCARDKTSLQKYIVQLQEIL